MLKRLIENEKISQLDIELAKLLTNEAVNLDQDTQVSEIFYLILLLSIANSRQHTCLDLNTVNWTNPFGLKNTILADEAQPLSVIEHVSLTPFNNLNALDQLDWDCLNSRYWYDSIGGKRKRCAEILIPNSIKTQNIMQIAVNGSNTLRTALQSTGKSISVVLQPELFF